MAEKSPMVIPVFELVLCLSQAVDLVSPLVADHHKRTAQIAYGLGKQLKLPEEELHDLVIAAALHDVGGLTQQDRLVTLDFEYQNPYGHSIMGYLLLKTFPGFKKSAEIVRFHHVPWQKGRGIKLDGQAVPLNSHLLQLADRVAVLIDSQSDILEQVHGILEKIHAQAGERFIPEQVYALEALAEKEAFWLDTVYLQSLNSLNHRLNWRDLEITEDEFLGLTNLFRRIIDFRSQFTSSHSAGVAAVAEHLARLCEFPETQCRMIHLAGLMHDLGKLAVPTEILEKPGKLTRAEFDIVRRHTYYTFHLLEPLKVLDLIRMWGSFHHERMDGRGYPFHLEENELPFGSRIVSVADIFTALTENRPYRKGIPGLEALQVLIDAVSQHRLDQHVVDVLQRNLEDINEARVFAQSAALEEYQHFVATAEALTPKF